jgi:flagellar motility protein MotE (MotC chaperone)
MSEKKETKESVLKVEEIKKQMKKLQEEFSSIQDGYNRRLKEWNGYSLEAKSELIRLNGAYKALESLVK